jgi:hypothetical protein
MQHVLPIPLSFIWRSQIKIDEYKSWSFPYCYLLQ